MGLVLVTKFSSILALPVYGLVLIVYALVKNNHEENNWKTRLKNLGSYLLKGLAALVVATIVVWIVYETSMFKMPKETFATTVDFFFSPTDTNIKTIYTNKILQALNEHDITRPLAAYVFGPAWTFKRVSGGNGAYFLGQVGNGFTAYFPVVFLIKETLPFLLLAIFAIIYTLKETFSNLKLKNILQRFAGFLRKSVVGYTLLIFIALYVFTSITGGLNIGFRHLFPILPFAYLLIGKKVFDFLHEKHPLTRQIFRVASSFLLLWIILTPIAAYPSYTSYFNESIGGGSNGYKYVTDSNTDWGQDLNRLKEYLDEQPQIEKIHVDYFGGGNVPYYLGNKYIPWYDSKRPVEKGWYAISTNYLQGSIYSDKNTIKNNYAWTLEYEPVTMIGKSIMIFYVEKPPVNQ